MLDKKDFLEEFKKEMVGTGKMLERVPFDKLDFKPHPKSMPLGILAEVLGSMPDWLTGIIKDDSMEISGYKPKNPKSLEELMKMFNDGVKKAEEMIVNLDEKSLSVKWSLLMNAKPIMEMPRGEALRDTLNHIVHHRAQLGVYLRMNDIPHPSLYGPSADER